MTNTKPKRLSRILVAVALVLAVVGTILLATSSREEAAVAEAGLAEEAAMRVRALPVTRRAVRDRIEVSGVIKPIRRALLSAEVDGRVAVLGAREHEAVTAEQRIVSLDDKIYQALADRSEAAVRRAKSSHRLAELELERRRSLFRKGVASQAELDRAAAEEEATSGALGEAEALRVEAIERLGRATIRAPFDGVLNEFDLEVGDRVDVGTRIGEVLDLSRVEIEIGVTDAQLVGLREGDPVEFEARVYPGRRFAGMIRRIGAAPGAATRKYPVEVVADNPGTSLLPGMVARVTCELGDEEPLIRIPRQATTEEFGLTYVFLLADEGEATVARRTQVKIRPVPFRPAELQVTEGLEGGQRIVAFGLRELRDGLPVTVESEP